MIAPLFDEPLSIYCGGIDNLVRHHDYSLAVLESIRPYPMAKYWLHCHHLYVDGKKMSKSLGNVVEPRALAAQYGVDQVRYFFLREMVFGLDAHFSVEALISRINADLANDLGNLLARSLGMAFKYRKGIVPPPGVPCDLDQEVILLAERSAADFLHHFPALEFSRALAGLWEFIGHLNRYIVANAPWELAKQPDAAPRLDTVLYHLLASSGAGTGAQAHQGAPRPAPLLCPG